VSATTIELPEEAQEVLKVPREQIGSELRLVAAIKLFEIGRLSSGAAARLAGIPRALFLSRLADYGVDTFDLTEEELRRDISNA
jgi:predicted HTH domain antitoxin